MSLYQVSFPVSGDQVDSLEELLFEIDEGRWNIYLDQDTQKGIASGVYDNESHAREDWLRMAPFIEEIVGTPRPDFALLPDTDWKDSYKEHFKPWCFKGLHWVPVWERNTYKIPEGDVVVWLDPGMAFGTGNHETTRLCIEALIQFIEVRKQRGLNLEGLSCCDAGCGSGILAISAKKMGFTHVSGFDNDPDSVRISIENSELNDLKGEIDFRVGELATGFQHETSDLVFANILGAVLVKHPTTLLSSVRRGGRLILSGILVKEVDDVRKAYVDQLDAIGRQGLFTSHQLGEWSDFVIDLS